MRYDPKKSIEATSNLVNGIPTSTQENLSEVPISSNPSISGNKPTKMSGSASGITPTKIGDSSDSCSCEPCLERRSIMEAEQQHKRLIHARTQIHHLLSCIYTRNTFFFPTIDADEFRLYVDILMSESPELLFHRVERTCQDYVNHIKTCLLQQLTNGFHSPDLAYNYVEAMFDECNRLENCARKVSTYFPQLVELLNRFHQATWENHHLNVFQRMVFYQPTINRTLSEIVHQLRQGSSQYETKHENKFTAALLKFHKFDTRLREVAVNWRDVQKLIDDYYEEKIDTRHKDQKCKTPEHIKPWNFYRTEEDSGQAKSSKLIIDKSDEPTLSLTLKKNSFSKSFINDPVSIKVNEEESDSDPPFESPLNSDGSLSEPHYPHQPTPTTDSLSMPYLCAEYLQNIHPPSVPSGDSDESSDNNDSSTQPLDHSHLIPLDPDGDSIDSLSPQLCTEPPSSFSRLDKEHLNNLRYHPPTRPFVFSTYQHLHQLQRQFFNPSEHSVNGSFSVDRPLPNVKTKLAGATNAEDISSHQRDSPHKDLDDSSPPIVNSEEILSSLTSSVFDSAAAEILADLPKVIRKTVDRVSDIAPLFGDLCKDSWSSPSSSSSSQRNESCSKSLLNRPKSKNVKLRKKKKILNKTKQLLQADENNFTDKQGQFTSIGLHSLDEKMPDTYKDDNMEPNKVHKDEFLDKSDHENEEVADDEYDGDEESEDTCKCPKCRQFLKSSQPLQSGNFFTPENKNHFLLQDYSGGKNGGDYSTCRCTNCLHLATASFLAAQHIPPVNHFNSFPSADVSNTNPPHPRYYNPMQGIHTSPYMIHPHLYRFQPVANGTNFERAYGQITSPQKSQDGHYNDKPISPKKNNTLSPINDKIGSGKNMFQHLPTNSALQWNNTDKPINTKFALNPAGGQGIAASALNEWSIPSNQAWVHGAGNVSGAIPHQLLSGCSSAFEHYINSGAQRFFSPILPGAAPLPHPGIHSSASYFTPTENEGTYTSTEGVNICSSNSTVTTNSNSVPTSASFSVCSTSSSTASSTRFTPASSNYLSSLYTPGLPAPDMSPFSKPPTMNKNAACPVTSSSHNSMQAQSVHFHPGASVNLKDRNHFNLAMHDNANLMFNPAVPQPVHGESLALTQSQNLFTIPTTLSQAPGLQSNPFEQSVSSLSNNLIGYHPNQNAIVTAPNTSNIPSSANSLQIRHHILRRKKLVAQSKLSKQLRPQQHLQAHPGQKAKDVENPAMQSFQNLQMNPQNSVTLPVRSPQAGSQIDDACIPVQTPSSIVDYKLSQNVVQTKEVESCNPEKTNPAACCVNPNPVKQTHVNHESEKLVENLDANPQEPTQTDHANHQDAMELGHDSCADGVSGMDAPTQTTPAPGNANNSKYCNCCYCEFFGNGGPTSAQANRNTKIRERLQRKLHTKAKEIENGDVKQHSKVKSASNEINHVSVDDLVSFIEGSGGGGVSKKGKKSRQNKMKNEKLKNEPNVKTHKDNKSVTNPVPVVAKDPDFSENNETDANRHPAPNHDEGNEDRVNSKKKKNLNKSNIQNVTGSADTCKTDQRETPLISDCKVKQVADKIKNNQKAKSLVDGKKKDGGKGNKKSDLNLPSQIKPAAKNGKHPKSTTQQAKRTECEFVMCETEYPLPVQTAPPAKQIPKSKATPTKGKQIRKLQTKANPSEPPQVCLPECEQNEKDYNQTAHSSSGQAHQVDQEHKTNKKDARSGMSQKQSQNSDKQTPRGKTLTNRLSPQDPLLANSNPRECVENGIEPAKTNSAELTLLKQLERENSESKKNRNRKQRKKNRLAARSSDNNELVDQVFLPREDLEQDERELDDTEMEIEKFKRFCLDSTIRNKEKKITVKWKEFNFKRNHFT